MKKNINTKIEKLTDKINSLELKKESISDKRDELDVIQEDLLVKYRIRKKEEAEELHKHYNLLSEKIYALDREFTDLLHVINANSHKLTALEKKQENTEEQKND